MRLGTDKAFMLKLADWCTTEDHEGVRGLLSLILVMLHNVIEQTFLASLHPCAVLFVQWTVMLCNCEANRRCGIALAIYYRLQWSDHLGPPDLRDVDRHLLTLSQSVAPFM